MADGPATPTAEDAYEGAVGSGRRRMPVERECITHKVEIGSPPAQGYIIAGRYEDGTLGEIFLHDFGKAGSTLEGWTQAFAIMFSTALQWGAEFPMLARKFAHMRFEPYGATDNPDIPYCQSAVDYIFRWLARHFGDEELNAELDRIAAEMQHGRSGLSGVAPGPPASVG